MQPLDLHRKYRDLQSYVGWTDADARRVRELGPLVADVLPELVDDFYREIERHDATRQVMVGGLPQIERLKGTLLHWLQDLLTGPYDEEYVARRWRVGWKHVEIGLPQVYTNVALSRLRRGLTAAVRRLPWPDPQPLDDAAASLHLLLDLDLAIIEDAYQTEFVQRLQRTERLAAIGQIAGGIAHELRNPLNVIKTSIWFLRHARQAGPEKVGEHLERMERQVGVADGVITALSNFARMPLPELKPIRAEDLVRETLALQTWPAEVAVQVDLEDGLPPVLADAGQLRIALDNLLRNAREAMPEGGTLRCLARRAEGGVELVVQDTGPGIAPDLLGRIMEPLFSTKARGLGLGLALARTLVEKNRGRLTVESTPGHGATFRILLHAGPTTEDTHERAS